MSKGFNRRQKRSGFGRKRLPMIALEGLEGRSLFSASLTPAGDLISPNTFEGQSFGTAVATKGNLALVGTGNGTAALYDTSTNSLVGVYVDQADTDGSLGHRFGASVTFFGSGDSFAIGAPGDDGGRVYVYTSPTSSPIILTAQQYLGYDAANWGFEAEFGTALAGYGDHLLVDSSGDLANGGGGTVKEINPTGGGVIRTFENPDTGFLGDAFGTHMAVSGTQILFYSQNLGALGPATVYLFDGTDFLNDGNQVRRFTDPAGTPLMMFGTSMAFDGDTVVIGAPNNDVISTEAGSVIAGSPVYQFSASTGQLVRTYDQPATVPTIPNYWTYSGWGWGLAISGDHLLIGAPQAFNDSFSDFAGQVYAYDLNTGEELTHTVAPDEGGMFGTAIGALSGDRFLVADPASNVLGYSAGLAHVYQLTVDNPPPQTSPPVAVAGDDQTAVIDTAASFSGSDSTADNGATIVSYEWDFNYDGTNFDADASGVDASFVYTATGTYTVALKVTDNHDKTSIDTLIVTVVLPAAPTADAGADQAALNGVSVSLAGTGAGTGTLSYEWDLDNDGTFDVTGTSASVIYTASGAHTVAFRVTDPYGQSAVDTLIVTTAAPAPTADAGADQASLAGDGVAFHGVATTGLGATVASVAWDFDYDGVTFDSDATGTDVSHAYATAGAHTVAFRVTDTEGNVVTDTAVVTVTAQAPTADAGAAQSAQTGDSVSFHGTATAGLGSSVTSVAWDFNYDGTTFDADATGADTSHVYTAAGNYIVAFRVTDADGQSFIDTTLVTVVTPAPPAPVAVVNGNLVVTAPTTSAGVFVFSQTANGISVTDGANTYGPFSPTGNIIIHGSPTGNLIIVPAGVTNPVEFYGGPGVDLVQGGAGNDILLGGGGVDVLSGGGGRNLIIGGAGSDVLVGSNSDDILIAGSTAFDNDPAALAAILAEWTSSHSYTQRVNNLRNSSPAANRLNGSVFLIADSTVFDDGSLDILSGGSGQDWFLFNNDRGIRDFAIDRTGNEIISDLDLLPH